MNYRIFYNLASLFFGITSIILVILIFSPITDENIFEKTTIEDELRIQRQILLDYANSDDPTISTKTKASCREYVDMINNALYSEEKISFEKEMQIRKQIKLITEKIKSEKFAPEYRSTYVIRL